jgi:cyclic beta-1,2-glucan synthetase
MLDVHLLSNGAYHVMVTAAGGGYSRCKDLAVTRWREEAARDDWGTFCYVRDSAGGVTWSNTVQNTGSTRWAQSACKLPTRG